MNRRVGQLIAIIFFISIVCLGIYLIIQKEKSSPPISSDNLNLKEALFYESLGNGMVQCKLCPRGCILADKQIGNCKARRNLNGKLYSLVYGKVAAKHVDPIEKKPLYHFLPGAKAFSIATTGCNLACKHCQNWDISQRFPWEVNAENLSSEQIVQQAKDTNSPVIAYTYSEPTIFYEYMLETAKLAQPEGIKNIMHSAGYINQEPLLELIPYLDGANIDLKAFRNETYQKLTDGTLEPVLETLKTLYQNGVWLEITYLVIPGYNDSEPEIKEMCQWVKENLSVEVPIHFSRFFPLHKLQNLIPTPVETLKRAKEIANEVGIKYVYIGNVSLDEGNITYCDDETVAIKRKGYFIEEYNLEDGKCGDGTTVAGVWWSAPPIK